MITKKTLEKLKKDLKRLEEERKEVAKKIKKAAAYGDLKENAEYHEAKDEQALLEGKILKLKNLIKNSKIAEKGQKDIVQIGSKIKTDQAEIEIVDSLDSDPLNWKISSESPLGKVFLGRKKGEVVEFQSEKYKILEIK